MGKCLSIRRRNRRISFIVFLRNLESINGQSIRGIPGIRETIINANQKLFVAKLYMSFGGKKG